MKISLFYGVIKFSEFTQYEAYDVKTLLGKITIVLTELFIHIVTTLHAVKVKL